MFPAIQANGIVKISGREMDGPLMIKAAAPSINWTSIEKPKAANKTDAKYSTRLSRRTKNGTWTALFALAAMDIVTKNDRANPKTPITYTK